MYTYPITIHLLAVVNAMENQHCGTVCYDPPYLNTPAFFHVIENYVHLIYFAKKLRNQIYYVECGRWVL